jgi:hypothetical protein
MLQSLIFFLVAGAFGQDSVFLAEDGMLLALYETWEQLHPKL